MRFEIEQQQRAQHLRDRASPPAAAAPRECVVRSTSRRSSRSAAAPRSARSSADDSGSSSRASTNDSGSSASIGHSSSIDCMNRGTPGSGTSGAAIDAARELLQQRAPPAPSARKIASAAAPRSRRASSVPIAGTSRAGSAVALHARAAAARPGRFVVLDEHAQRAERHAAIAAPTSPSATVGRG